MRKRLLLLKIPGQGLTAVRERARQIGELFGLGMLQRTRLVTAVSEVASLAQQHGSEPVLSFQLDSQSPNLGGPALVAEIVDSGAGIARLDAGGHRVRLQPAQTIDGVEGARRMVDHLSLLTPAAGGTVVTLEVALPIEQPLISEEEINERLERLLAREPGTAMEELERQNRETLLALEEMRQRQLVLQQADVRKNEFLAVLAHELRNPLATMNMTLAILRRKAVVTPEDLAKRCEVMNRQVTQLGRLVDDLTDVTRVDRGKVELRRSPVELNSLVRDALEMTSAPIALRRHSVLFQPSPHDLWVRGDAMRLLQVVGNVIQNASKYTPEEGRIEVRVHQLPNEAVIDVIDNGAGIEAELQPLVFGMFVQGRHRSGDDNAGMGIGLTLADRLVRDHGGSIAVKSDGAGRGSRFTITLPLPDLQASSVTVT